MIPLRIGCNFLVQPRHLIVLTITQARQPHVAPEDRYSIKVYDNDREADTSPDVTEHVAPALPPAGVKPPPARVPA